MNSTPADPVGSINRPRLSVLTKLAYGAGDFGPAVTANILAFFSLIFLTNVAGLNPGLAGSVLLVGKVWDAVNDPLVGVLSDRTQSRWGRRYPWMIWGAVPFGIFFFLQWIVPGFSINGLFWYYVIMSIIFNTFYTAVNLPYTALTPELTQDYNERTSLNSFRFAFSIGGSIVSLILGAVIFFQLKQPAPIQYAIFTGIATVISVIPLYLCVWGTWHSSSVGQNQSQPIEDQSLPLWEQLRIVFTNYPFLYVIGIYLCSWLGIQGTAAVLPYYVAYSLQRPPSEFTTVALAVQGTALAMLFVWSQVSVRVGKKVTYALGAIVWILAQGGLFFLPPGQVAGMYLLAVMAGIGVSTGYLIPWSMLPDVIELDELKTGQRREGIFYAFMVLLQKIGLAIGLFVIGQTLEWSGFVETVAGQPPPDQPASALFAIRIMIGPFPTVVLIVGLILVYFYPISRDVHAEILLRLQNRTGA
jgi:glycoside/pentoside/hexuronide:cation symporter, GPH family